MLNVDNGIFSLILFKTKKEKKKKKTGALLLFLLLTMPIQAVLIELIWIQQQ